MKDKYLFLRSSDIFSHITNMKYIPRWVVLFVDFFFCVLSFYASYYLSLKLFNNSIDLRVLTFYERMGIILGCQIAFFWMFHTYSGVLRYSGYVDATKLLFAVFLNILSRFSSV